MCFSTKHKARDCDTGMKCGVVENGKKCTEPHYRAFHNADGKVAAGAAGKSQHT